MNHEVKKVRGVFEKVSGSGEWWICYFDADGRKRREKAGRKGDAIALYRKRKTEALQGRKLPETLRARPIRIVEIAEAALEYSRIEKSSYSDDCCRMRPIVARFGNCAAKSIKPEEFERWLNDEAEERQWSTATKNRYVALIKLTYRLAERNEKIESNPARLLRMRKENNERVRYLGQYEPDEEAGIRAVIARDYPRHRPEFEIALHTGMRRSELEWRGRT
jgi:integrase